MPNGDHLVAPRVLARTTVVTRTVVALPDGYALQEPQEDAATVLEVDPERSALQDEQQRFWKDFLVSLKLDDPEQPTPRPAREGYLLFMLPAPNGSSWLTVYGNLRRNEVGVYLSSSRNSAGEYAMETIAKDWDVIKGQLAGTANLLKKEGRCRIIDSFATGPLDQAEVRERAFTWLAERVNTFVNIMRPRVRSAVADYQSRGEVGGTP